MNIVAALASATTLWADIVGVLILAIIAAGVYAVVSLLFLPKTASRRSRRLDEEEARRRERLDEKGRRAA